MAYLGEDTPKLGFGLMRLPRKGKDVDIEQLKEMVDRFLESGFTYFDTARAYGDSEAAIREALVDRYPRESYTLATKNAAWLGAKSAEDARQMFTTSLETTGAGYFDFYLMHNLGRERTQVFDNFDLWDFAKEQREKGLIKHLGFSMHDNADVLEQIIEAHPEFEFVQLQINYADWNSPEIQSGRCFEVAREHGLPVVIMEPVKGGMLADPPAGVKRVLQAADPDASCASWAIRFAMSLPGIITVLSGMSSIDQMEDNLVTAKDFKPLDDADRKVIERAQSELAKVDTIPCTSCRYCTKECPKQVPIPDIFGVVNAYRTYGDKSGYAWATHTGVKASDCIKCGQCEMACPQSIHIIHELEEAAKLCE